MEISLAQPEVPKSVGKGQDFGLSLIFDFLLHSFFLSMLNWYMLNLSTCLHLLTWTVTQGDRMSSKTSHM